MNFAKEVSLSESTVEVQSIVVAKSGEVPIDYRIMKKENGWKVCDVVIERVSLISNYRTQVREILGNNPLEKLLETLRKKLARDKVMIGSGLLRSIHDVPVNRNHCAGSKPHSETILVRRNWERIRNVGEGNSFSMKSS